MRILCDRNKNIRNQAKHKVSFEVASLVFEDPFHLSRIDRIVDGEVRWQTIGMVGGVLLLLVAHTWEDTDGEMGVRIISARKADTHERKRYEEETH
jgi:uncharacterized DUF497 family protein